MASTVNAQTQRRKLLSRGSLSVVSNSHRPERCSKVVTFSISFSKILNYYAISVVSCKYMYNVKNWWCMDLYYRIVHFFQSDLILTNKKGVCHISYLKFYWRPQTNKNKTKTKTNTWLKLLNRFIKKKNFISVKTVPRLTDILTRQNIYIHSFLITVHNKTKDRKSVV